MHCGERIAAVYGAFLMRDDPERLYPPHHHDMTAMRVVSIVQPGWSTAIESEIYLQHVGAYINQFGA